MCVGFDGSSGIEIAVGRGLHFDVFLPPPPPIHDHRPAVSDHHACLGSTPSAGKRLRQAVYGRHVFGKLRAFLLFPQGSSL